MKPMTEQRLDEIARNRLNGSAGTDRITDELLVEVRRLKRENEALVAASMRFTEDLCKAIEA